MADQTNAEVSDERLREASNGLEAVIGWLAELDYPGVGTQMQKVRAAADELDRRSVTSQASEGAEYWAVWSRTGAHIGTWDSEEIARAVHLGQYPDGIVLHLYASPSKRVERLEAALRQFVAAQDAYATAEGNAAIGLAVGLRVKAEEIARQALQGGRS